MMLLTETMKNSTSAIKKKKAMQDNKKAAEDFVKALRKLYCVSQVIKVNLDCATEMKKSGIVPYPVMKQQMRDELLELADSCGRGAFEGTLTMDMVTALEAKGDSVAQQMKIVWEASSAQYAEGTKGYLSMIAELTDNPKRARELVDSITKTVGGAFDVCNIKKLVKEVAEAKEIVDAFSLNPEMEDFLRKVSSFRATAVDLTPDVLVWLQEKGLMSKLRIIF